jgi:hypothetical protein
MHRAQFTQIVITNASPNPGSFGTTKSSLANERLVVAISLCRWLSVPQKKKLESYQSRPSKSLMSLSSGPVVKLAANHRSDGCGLTLSDKFKLANPVGPRHCGNPVGPGRSRRNSARAGESPCWHWHRPPARAAPRTVLGQHGSESAWHAQCGRPRASCRCTVTGKPGR